MGHYGKIKDGKVIEILPSKPRWFTEDRKPVTDDYLRSQNIYPIVINELDSFDSLREQKHYRKPDELIVDEENKVIRNYVTKSLKNLDDIYKEKIDQIHNIRNSKLFTDIPYEFSDMVYEGNEKSHIQVRNECDVNNIQMKAIEATKRIMDKKTEISIFRDKENVNHSLSDDEVLEMAEYVLNLRENIYISSWTHKNNIESIMKEEISDEEKVDKLVKYDVYAGW